MNAQMKRRLVVATGVIVVVLAIVLAVVGNGGSARSLSIADALGGSGSGERVQVTGNVVDNSYSTEGGVLAFSIYDPAGDPSQTLAVRYEGAASSTFGNGVTAICTGRLSDDGGLVLNASELVTKCPSKYESATDALGIGQLLGYGADIQDKTVKITGVVKEGTLVSAGSDERFVVVDAADASQEVPIAFDDALPEEVQDGTSVVIQGSLGGDGRFNATDVAIEEGN